MKAFVDTPESEFPHFFKIAASEWLQAVSRSDVIRLAKVLAPGMHYITSEGVVFGRERYLEKVASGELVYEAGLSTDQEYNFQEGSVFVLIGQVRGQAMVEGGSRGIHARYATTWLRRENGWQLLLVQKTPLS